MLRVEYSRLVHILLTACNNVAFSALNFCLMIDTCKIRLFVSLARYYTLPVCLILADQSIMLCFIGRMLVVLVSDCKVLFRLLLSTNRGVVLALLIRFFFRLHNELVKLLSNLVLKRVLSFINLTKLAYLLILFCDLDFCHVQLLNMYTLLTAPSTKRTLLR